MRLNMAQYNITLPVTYWTSASVERPEGLTRDQLLDSLDFSDTDDFDFDWKAFRIRILDLIEEKDKDIELEEELN